MSLHGRYMVALSGLWLLIALLAFNSLHYLFAMLLACISLFVVIYFSLNNQQQGKEIVPEYDFQLSVDGKCTLPHFLCSEGEQSYEVTKGFWQIQANSRVSFLGCWLYLQLENENTTTPVQSKRLFVFKPCLSAQSFSRLSRIVYRVSKQNDSD